MVDSALLDTWVKCQQDNCDGGFTFTSTTSPKKKYCSDECRVTQKRNIAMRIVHICALEECGVEYRSTAKVPKFCSHSCSAKFTNKLPYRRTSKKSKICPVCGEATTNPKYCSSRCSGDAKRTRTALLIEAWLRGEVAMSSKNMGLMDVARKFLYEQAGHKCTECGWAEVHPTTGKVPLCVDHVDGDWRNNFVSNLKVLCFNCHTLTPTFGALNR